MLWRLNGANVAAAGWLVTLAMWLAAINVGGAAYHLAAWRRHLVALVSFWRRGINGVTQTRCRGVFGIGIKLSAYSQCGLRPA